MPTAAIETGIGHIQQFGDKGRVFADDVPDFFGAGPLIPAQLQHLQGQSRDRGKSFAIFNTLKNLGIHDS
jgi:hypothetical protein